MTEHGLDRISVEAIAEHAGCTRGALQRPLETALTVIKGSCHHSSVFT